MTARGPTHDELARLEDALRRLSQFEREVFLAVRLDQLSFEKIAERTGLTPDQAERVFVRALTGFVRNLANPRRRWWRRMLR